MTDVELLRQVKIGLFGTDAGEWRDATLTLYINEVRDFMRGAGVAESVLSAESSAGVYAIGVNDLWNHAPGGVKFSEYFIQRVIQLSARGGAS